MTLYQVELRREQVVTVFVDADDPTEAKEGAEELAAGMPWQIPFEPEVDICDPLPRAPHWAEGVWVGGVQGEWITAEDYNARNGGGR